MQSLDGMACLLQHPGRPILRRDIILGNQPGIALSPLWVRLLKIVQDVLKFYREDPTDWKKAWHKLQDKWEYTDICGAGIDYNIDAKLNGAYIVIGLLYDEGDVFRTMDISTRCGHDSDCNFPQCHVRQAPRRV